MNKIIIILIFLCSNLSARDVGQTEIITDEGVEVFQKEKYYLLKKNVKINSDNYSLSANSVKAFFETDLYDIIYIESKGNALLKSKQGSTVKGELIKFFLKDERIEVYGINSSIEDKDLKMFSNEFIKIDNKLGSFILNGKNSVLENNTVYIIGEKILGSYNNVNDIKEISKLVVEDKLIANFKTNKFNLYASKAIYTKNDNIIELFENVKIVRDGETIIGDYAKINTFDQSYKIKSNNKNKVKILINKTNE